jgi:tRNA1Val (adenine37-N6)-methyltransferase
MSQAVSEVAALPAATAESDDQLTCDPILRGRLTLWQPRVGYRFSLDPLLLANFIGTAPLGRVIDIGAGVGVVGLLLARLDSQAQLTLVELQPRLAALCLRNAAHNQLAPRCTVVEGDVRSAAVRKQLPGAWFDLVASCPPYYQLGRGGVNPDSEEAIARHEIHLPLAELVRAARRLVGFRGRVALVYPSPRLPELLSALVAEGLTPTRLRLVHTHADQPAQRALVEGRKGARGGLVALPPLILRHPDGSYSEEARRLFGDAE